MWLNSYQDFFITFENWFCSLRRNQKNALLFTKRKTITHPESGNTLLPRPNTWIPNKIQHFTIVIDVPSLVCYSKRKCNSLMRFSHSKIKSNKIKTIIVLCVIFWLKPFSTISQLLIVFEANVLQVQCNRDISLIIAVQSSNHSNWIHVTQAKMKVIYSIDTSCSPMWYIYKINTNKPEHGFFLFFYFHCQNLEKQTKQIQCTIIGLHPFRIRCE